MKISLLLKSVVFAVFTSASTHAADVIVDYALRYQTVRGIGTSTRVDDSYLRQSSIQDYYLNDFGASAYRTWLPYTTLTSTTTIENIKWQNFNSTAAEQSLRIAIDLKLKKPSLMLIGTFWTPPGWMKVSGNDNGTDGSNSSVNVLRVDREDHYAKFVLETAKMMRDKYHTPLDAISLNNEPRFDTFYGSCVYSDEQYSRVFKKIVDVFRADDYDMKFFGPEHMTADWSNNRNLVEDVLNDPEYTDAMPYLAAHGYTNGVASDSNPSSATNFWVKFADPYNKEFWMTETSGEPHTWDGALNGIASSMHNAFVGGNASLYTYWLFNHESAYHVEELFEKAVPQKKAYAFQHYSKYLRPGMVRIDATPSTNQQLDVSAWADFEQQNLVMVVLNRSASPKTSSIKLMNNTGITAFNVWRTTASEAESFKQLTDINVSESGEFTLSMPALSIVTLRTTGVDFVVPEYTVSPAGGKIVPFTATTYTFDVATTQPTYRWTSRSKGFWAKITEGADNIGDGTVAITMQKNLTNTSRTTTLLIADQAITITQLPQAPETIFKTEATANLGWGTKWNSLYNYFYDVYYPFVYPWDINNWLYIHPDGSPTETAGFYFYRFDEEHWGWSNASLYPYYIPFDGGSSDPRLLVQPPL